MAANRNAQPGNGLSLRLKKSRQTIATCFVQCLTETGTSQERAARAMGITKRTVGAWSRCERPITVERVMAAPRLAKAFRDALCTHDHDAPVPYIASKAAGKARGGNR
jgi:hypothetical protein